MCSSDVTRFESPSASDPAGSAEQPLDLLSQVDFDPSEAQRLTVVFGGLENCASSYVIERSGFPFYALECVVSGSGRFLAEGIAHDLGPGSVYSYGPSVAHRLSGNGDAPLSRYVVCFTGTDARHLLCSCGLAPGSIRRVYPAEVLIPLFEEIVQSSQRKSGDTRLRSRLLECLAIKLGRSQSPWEDSQADLLVEATPDTVAFAKYQMCRRHIEAHFERLRTLDEVAAECRTSSAYLCRLFREYDQQSPYQYLLHLKMGRAADLLRQPGALVKQVAEQLGFADPFHFSRVFRRVVGVPPSSLRPPTADGSEK